jgi:hypothetical protein
MSTPPPLSISHTVRASALESQKTWRIDGDKLWICNEGQPELALPLNSILKLRLSYDPSRIEPNLYRCRLYNRIGKCATIQNCHYQGIASFEDRTESYLPFVHALISRLASVNPHCQFISGTSHLSWWAHAIFITVSFSFLALVLFYLYSAVGWLAILKLLIIAFFIPTALQWFIKNWPRTFSPHSIPNKLLPQAPRKIS